MMEGRGHDGGALKNLTSLWASASVCFSSDKIVSSDQSDDSLLSLSSKAPLLIAVIEAFSIYLMAYVCCSTTTAE